MFKKIYNYIQIFWSSLFFGIKNVDNLLTNSQKTQNNFSFEVSDQCDDNVFKDMLQQKITQEVEELRYTSYKIANESKKYRYVGNGKVLKKTNSQLSEKHVAIEESDNLPIILIQDNALVCEDILTSLNEVNQHNNKKVFNEYHIKIERNSTPRFRIENYVKKIVVKQAEDNYVIDLYCSKYPRQFSERKDKPFLSELKRIQNSSIKNSDIFDFQKLSFITSNAWGVDDWFKFSFIDFEFFGIIEYDGNYIIRFGCLSETFMENILNKIYSESAEKKYAIKESKGNSTVNFINVMQTENYKIDERIDLESLENIDFSIDNKIN